MSSNKLHSSWENEFYLFLILIFMQHLICVTACCVSFCRAMTTATSSSTPSWTTTSSTTPSTWTHEQPPQFDPSQITLTLLLCCHHSPFVSFLLWLPVPLSSLSTRFLETNQTMSAHWHFVPLRSLCAFTVKSTYQNSLRRETSVFSIFGGAVVTATASLISGSIPVTRLPACGFSSGLGAETRQSFIRIK